MKTTTETIEIIKSQLLENTGKSFLDSGDFYGRNYERNQKNGIDLNPLKIDKYGVTINVAAYMNTMLDRNDVCEKIENHFKEKDIYLGYYNGDEINLELENHFDVDFNGYLCSENWFNTYNYDNDLSQTLQGVIFEIDKESYCILETHNGCDVRGGYSAGRVYLIRDIDYFFNTNVEIENPDDEGGNPFESLYTAEKEGMYWNEDLEKWGFDRNGEFVEARFYTSAMGF
jgi:hypothetical protein